MKTLDVWPNLLSMELVKVVFNTAGDITPSANKL